MRIRNAWRSATFVPDTWRGDLERRMADDPRYDQRRKQMKLERVTTWTIVGAVIAAIVVVLIVASTINTDVATEPAERTTGSTSAAPQAR